VKDAPLNATQQQNLEGEEALRLRPSWLHISTASLICIFTPPETAHAQANISSAGITSQPVSNDATLNSRASQSFSKTAEEEEFATRRVGLGPQGQGKFRIACMLGKPDRDLTLDGKVIDFTKACLAVMDEAAHSQDVHGDLGFEMGIYAAYVSIARIKGYPGGDLGAGRRVFEVINAAILQNMDKRPAIDRPAPIVATLTNGQTVRVYNGMALDIGYTGAYTYYYNSMLDALNVIKGPWSSLTQSQLESLASRCISNDANMSLGQCLAVGAERLVRAVPYLLAQPDRRPRAR